LARIRVTVDLTTFRVACPNGSLWTERWRRLIDSASTSCHPTHTSFVGFLDNMNAFPGVWCAGAGRDQPEGKSPVTLKPGDVLFIPAGAAHASKNVGNRKRAELATYIVEKGKPLFTEVGGRFPR